MKTKTTRLPALVIALVFLATGARLGIATVAEAVGDPDVRAYLDRLVANEILPTLPGDSDENRAYAATTFERFAMPGHALSSIALNALAKWGVRNLPVVRDAWADGRDAPLTVFALAALLALDEANPGQADPDTWARQALAHLGYDVDTERLAAEVGRFVRQLRATGTRRALTYVTRR